MLQISYNIAVEQSESVYFKVYFIHLSAVPIHVAIFLKIITHLHSFVSLSDDQAPLMFPKKNTELYGPSGLQDLSWIPNLPGCILMVVAPLIDAYFVYYSRQGQL